MVPVRMIEAGQSAKVIRVRGNDEVRARLAGLGFVENAVICVVGQAGGGNLIVSVAADTRIALDASLSSRIMVEPLPVSVCETQTAAEGGNRYEKPATSRLWQHG